MISCSDVLHGAVLEQPPQAVPHASTCATVCVMIDRSIWQAESGKNEQYPDFLQPPWSSRLQGSSLLLA